MLRRWDYVSPYTESFKAARGTRSNFDLVSQDQGRQRITLVGTSSPLENANVTEGADV